MDVLGRWNIDDSDRVCTSLVIGRVALPSRRQYRYRRGQDYFFCDSDSDRSARVVRRTPRP
jgi:hypothetical protein